MITEQTLLAFFVGLALGQILQAAILLRILPTVNLNGAGGMGKTWLLEQLGLKNKKRHRSNNTIKKQTDRVK